MAMNKRSSGFLHTFGNSIGKQGPPTANRSKHQEQPQDLAKIEIKRKLPMGIHMIRRKFPQYLLIEAYQTEDGFIFTIADIKRNTDVEGNIDEYSEEVIITRVSLARYKFDCFARTIKECTLTDWKSQSGIEKIDIDEYLNEREKAIALFVRSDDQPLTSKTFGQTENVSTAEPSLSKIAQMIQKYDVHSSVIDLYNMDIKIVVIDDTDSPRQYILRTDNIPVNALGSLKKFDDKKSYEVYSAEKNGTDKLARVIFHEDLWADLPDGQEDPDYYGPIYREGDSLRVSNAEWRQDIPDCELIRVRLEVFNKYNPFMVDPYMKNRGFYDAGATRNTPCVYEYGFIANTISPLTINNISAEDTRLILKCVLRCVAEKDSYRIITPWNIPKFNEGTMTLTFANGETRTYPGFYTYVGAKFDTLKLMQDIQCLETGVPRKIV